MLFRRTCKLVEMETARKNVEKAKPIKKTAVSMFISQNDLVYKDFSEKTASSCVFCRMTSRCQYNATVENINANLLFVF